MLAICFFTAFPQGLERGSEPPMTSGKQHASVEEPSGFYTKKEDSASISRLAVF